MENNNDRVKQLAKDLTGLQAEIDELKEELKDLNERAKHCMRDLLYEINREAEPELPFVNKITGEITTLQAVKE